MEEKTIMFNFLDGTKLIKVGDTIFTIGGYGNKEGTIKIITKIGTKYIKASSFSGRSLYDEMEFYIENGRQKTEYSEQTAYSSKEGYDIVIKQNHFVRKVINRFQNYQTITYEQAVKIGEILGIVE